MKYNDLQQKSPKELQKMLETTRTDAQKLKFAISNDQEKGVRKLRALKKRVAQILTALNQTTN